MKRLAFLAALLAAAALAFTTVGFGSDDPPANGEKRQLDPPDDGLNGPTGSTTVYFTCILDERGKARKCSRDITVTSP